MKLRIRAYRATKEPQTCGNFVIGHQKVLEDYGISGVTSNNEVWVNNPNVYCLIAESLNDNKIVAGLRLQVSDVKVSLPVELAVGRMDKKIYNLVKQFRNAGGVAELCALWNASSVAGKGLSPIIVRAGVAIANQIRINTLLCICADYTLKMFQKVGFVIDHSLGTKGEFPYPNKYYRAKVLGILNTLNLGTAEEQERKIMTELRNRPVQHTVEQGIGEEIEIDYNLIINQ